MAKFYDRLEPKLRDFIARQHVFFTATAAEGARINLSPKGLDALRILDDTTIAYLDWTGSGNETAAHIRTDGRLTIMMCAFEGAPNILRLYGRGEVAPKGSDAYRRIVAETFDGNEPAAARQVILLHIESGADLVRVRRADLRACPRAALARQLGGRAGRPSRLPPPPQRRQHRRHSERPCRGRGAGGVGPAYALTRT